MAACWPAPYRDGVTCPNPSCCPPHYNVFDDREVGRKLKDYRKNGPDAQSRELVEVLERQGIEGATAVEIGAGIGAIAAGVLGIAILRSGEIVILRSGKNVIF